MKSGVTGKWISYLTVLLAAAVVVLAAALWIPEKDADEETQTENTRNTAEGTEAGNAISAPEIQKIQELIKAYYTARAESDVDLLNTLVEADQPFTMVEIASDAQYIEKYDDLVTYVVRNEAEGYEVAYVTYNIYFKGITTGAPAMNRFIVREVVEGTYRIVDREPTGEMSSFLSETEKSETVQRMMTEVNGKLKEASEQDEVLKAFLEFLHKE